MVMVMVLVVLLIRLGGYLPAEMVTQCGQTDVVADCRERSMALDGKLRVACAFGGDHVCSTERTSK